ncbi:hypothetical protein [Hymenobacter sp. DG25A]|uniref:hypothetical protein n=1 Tax=Hymenobacter sp. DG25A TaxID=1385663 RepID=UPI0006BE13A2|nr:hypothetical protein [Hymenobacter sp. DG25A]ALD20309.1 hypothetical protein AM218_02500 [Hymenobacter sp. DG25A]
MSALAYEQLLREAFRTDADAARYLTEPDTSAYAAFEHASKADQAFRFERVRLGVAMSLMKLLAELGDHEESRRVLDILHRALRARSSADIDAIITRDAKAFERLYTNLYVNDEGELLLQLFEMTLDADSKQRMDEVIAEALALLPELDFSHHADEDEDEE